MNVVPPDDRKGEVRVVDLSRSDRTATDGTLERRHERVLAYLRQRGEASKDDLLAHFPKMSYEEVLRTVEDLARRGEVEIRWQGPFRFVVGLPGPSETPSRSLVLA